MAAVGVVLLVACANLAGLLIVRSSARQQEIAVRLFAGRRARPDRAAAADRERAARRRRRRRRRGARVLGGRSAPRDDVARPRRESRSMSAPNARTLAFAAAVTIVTAVLFGLLPALGASRTDVQPGLKLGASGADRHAERLGTGDGGRAGCAARPPAHVGRPVYADAAEAARRRCGLPPGSGARRERGGRARVFPRTARVRCTTSSLRGSARCPACSRSACPWTRRLPASCRCAPGIDVQAVRRIPRTRRACATTSWGRASSRRWGFRCWPGAISRPATTSVRRSDVVISESVARRYFPAMRIRSAVRSSSAVPCHLRA